MPILIDRTKRLSVEGSKEIEKYDDLTSAFAADRIASVRWGEEFSDLFIEFRR